MKKLFILFVLLTVALPSYAQNDAVYADSCKAIPKLKKKALRAYYEIGPFKEHADQMTEISNDAKNLNYASAALATVSATAGIGLSYGAAAAPIIIQDKFTLLGTILYMKASFLLTLGGGSIPAIPSMAAIVAVSLISPIDSYFLTTGTYHLLTNLGSKIEVSVEELRLKENELRELIQKDTDAIEDLIANPPGAFSNGIKFGSPMRKHFEKIAGLSQRRAQAAEAIYKMRAAEAEMLLMACMSH